MNNYISTADAAERLGYTKQNITHLIRKGKLPAVKRGRMWLILIADLDLLIDGVMEHEYEPKDFFE